ncbi:MAG: tRNA adenosine deaminase-associated protein [Actinomycetes bacterium]
MSYFTAVIARDGDKWFARDIDVDGLESLTELTDAVRLLENDDEPVLVFIEREDAWWAVIRVDGDDDPRIFVSDVIAATASPYAALLDVEPPVEDEEGVTPGTYGGDSDLLADLGTSPEDLVDMCEEELIPMDALAAVAEAGGFAEVLDSLR